ncbi:unnamed protein product [Larinioides sclopetarius]|uniref:Uncharacterized protein n=1 Tax=Larinioides sclopetarius TaxID=280406 RepID=A0AAV2AZ27_9ARAC
MDYSLCAGTVHMNDAFCEYCDDEIFLKERKQTAIVKGKGTRSTTSPAFTLFLHKANAATEN